MGFTVYLTVDGSTSHEYGDDDRYELSSSGTLVVRPAESGTTYTYSQWAYMTADTDHTAGGSKKGGKSGNATSV